MVSKYNNKKGAVELSLNLIIMLIIGLTVLGLVIAFVTGFLNQAGEGLQDTLSQEDEANINAVKDLSGNFNFLQREVTTTQGETEKLFFKYRNTDATDISLPGQIADSGSITVTLTNADPAGSDPTGQITFTTAPISVSSGTTEGGVIRANIDSTLQPGVYYAVFTGAGASVAITFVVE